MPNQEFFILSRTLKIVPVLLLLLSCQTPNDGLAEPEEDVAAGFFSESYKEAREKFVTEAKKAGAQVFHFKNPYTGSEGESLFTDVAAFSLQGAETVLVIGSGTHGVEGFAGSAIQVGLLQSGIAEKLPDNVGLLFYHALNPYGFSHLRRFNEDNIDLNRNFVDDYQGLPNDDYEELAWIFEPASLSVWENIQAKAALVWYRITEGTRWLQSAISRGQYKYPKGIFYGGMAKTWSNHTLADIVEDHLSSVFRVILIDIHTGLGEHGAAEAITEIAPGDQRYEWMQQCWDIPVTNPHSGDAVSPPITGPLKRGFTKMLSSGELIAVSLEFGTYPPSEVLWALRAENHIHHHGGWEHPDAGVIKEALKRAFYPQQPGWKESVWRHGSLLVRQTLNCLH